MAPASAPKDPIALTETFEYKSTTHSFTIKWRSLGDVKSPPLVFVHGTPWSSRVWEPYALALSREFHVYLFDNPGFGDSPLEQALPGKIINFKNEVEELDADLARQSEAFASLFTFWQEGWAERKAHVIAHDHAGLMTLRANLLHGCQYASLCLIDVVAIGPFGQPLFKSVGEVPHAFEQLPDMTFEGIVESYIRNASFSELPKDIMTMLKAPWLGERGKSGFIRQMCQANWRNTDAIEGRYSEIGEKMPVQVIWGAQDDWIPVETAHRLRDALRAQEIVIIDKAGHLCMYDQPGQLGIELGQWLSKCSA